VSDAKHQHNQSIVLERADDAVISDAVAPELAKHALKALANLAGIVKLSNPFMEKFQNAAADSSIKLVYLLLGGW
jgi:hypothetical protein